MVDAAGSAARTSSCAKVARPKTKRICAVSPRWYTTTTTTTTVPAPPPLPPGQPAPPPPPLDHFLCYSAASVPSTDVPGFAVPAGVGLINQFNPPGILPQIGPLTLHCNPVEKLVGPQYTFVTNPDAHLVCWRMSASTQPSYTVQVTNQFGSATLTTGAPTELCLPSWKSETGNPFRTPTEPPGLSHFTCYTVSYAPGSTEFSPPGPVQLEDQFSAQFVPVTVGNPVGLCLPTLQYVGGDIALVANPDLHLLCFKVSQTPRLSPVFDENRFGTGEVNVSSTRTLCVPSTKTIVTPPTGGTGGTGSTGGTGGTGG